MTTKDSAKTVLKHTNDGQLENQQVNDQGGPQAQIQTAKEYGGPKGKEPTRYGDWEKNGRCIDF